MNMTSMGVQGFERCWLHGAIIAELVTNADADCYELNWVVRKWCSRGQNNSFKITRQLELTSIARYKNSGSSDEADFLSPRAQASLRYIVEKSAPRRSRFLFTANNVKQV